jgi:hypothetical protein
MTMTLASAQLAIVQAPVNTKVFLHGPAGSGKSTVGVERLRHLLSLGVPGESILLLTPQRTLQEPYLAVARFPDIIAGTEITPATVGGLARRMCELFWPIVADDAGFAHPDRAPLFLTLETSQYYMAHIVRPLLDQGYFESVTMDRNRLYAQILDSLNKSAAVGFPYSEIGARLDRAWSGDPAQRRIYADAQDCATRFRQFCLQHNLLDFSLQLEVFWAFLWRHPTVHDHLVRTYRHLIYDNLEEDVPRAHDLVREWMPDLESVLLVYDDGAGYRRFLGADVETGRALRDLCPSQLSLTQSFVMSPAVERLGFSLAAAMDSSLSFQQNPAGKAKVTVDQGVLGLITRRFYPELIDAVVDEVRSILSEGTISAAELVIVAPYLSDALRFGLTNRLEAHGIPWRTHRPSRSLRDEPASQTLLTIAALAHPHWNVRPSRFDVAQALMLALQIDWVRAQLLSEIIYRERDFSLSPFDRINPDKQERITFVAGNRYSVFRDWLLACRDQPALPLDHFLRRLFGEVLSQPGFGFHLNLDAARIAGSLIESVRKFRLAMEPSFVDLDHPDFDLGREYFQVLEDGILAAQYLESWRGGEPDAILVAPAYSYLMMNHPATIQFWLDPGSSGWFQRLDQPLTHTRVLSRGWPADRQWMYGDEEQANLESMRRLVLGLVRRCRQKIYLCMSTLGESGFEQRGRLLIALQAVLKEQQHA